VELLVAMSKPCLATLNTADPINRKENNTMNTTKSPQQTPTNFLEKYFTFGNLVLMLAVVIAASLWVFKPENLSNLQQLCLWMLIFVELSVGLFFKINDDEQRVSSFSDADEATN
jgi:FtsH-binding integral membrane protein